MVENSTSILLSGGSKLSTSAALSTSVTTKEVTTTVVYTTTSTGKSYLPINSTIQTWIFGLFKRSTTTTPVFATEFWGYSTIKGTGGIYGTIFKGSVSYIFYLSFFFFKDCLMR